jgi:hypothetical protein
MSAADHYEAAATAERAQQRLGAAVLAHELGIPTRDAPIADRAGANAAWWVDSLVLGISSAELGSSGAHNILGLLPGVREQAARYLASGATELIAPPPSK